MRTNGMMTTFKQKFVLIFALAIFLNLFGISFDKIRQGDLIGAHSARASVDFNCYCLDGSLIPAYYPDKKKLNTSDFDSCNQECANIGAKYFSFSTVAHAGTTKVSAKPSTNTQQAPSQNNVGSSGAIADSKIPGVTTEDSQIIKCGRAGQNMCTLCDLIAGLNYIIKYLMKIAIGVALLAVTIGGVMYVVSAGDKGQIDTAKKTMTNAGIGFVIIFSGYLIINTTISYIGSKKTIDANGVEQSTFGMNITSWGNFECTAKDRGGSN